MYSFMCAAEFEASCGNGSFVWALAALTPFFRKQQTFLLFISDSHIFAIIYVLPSNKCRGRPRCRTWRTSGTWPSTHTRCQGCAGSGSSVLGRCTCWSRTGSRRPRRSECVWVNQPMLWHGQLPVLPGRWAAAAEVLHLVGTQVWHLQQARL